MYSNVQDFLAQYGSVSQATHKLLSAVSETNFNHEPNEHVRSTGRMAWHIARAVGGLGELLPINVTSHGSDAKPATAAATAALYENSAKELMSEVKAKISNDMLGNEIDFYGMKKTIGEHLWTIVSHEIHHRGQLQTIMRVVGDVPVGVAGPTDEEMKAMMAARQ